MTRAQGKLEAFEDSSEMMINLLSNDNKPLTPEDLSDRVSMYLAWLSGKLCESREALDDENGIDRIDQEGEEWKNE
jgi:hypothetical protein